MKMKKLLGLSRSVCSASALLLCAAVLLLPSSAVALPPSLGTVVITVPNTVLSGDIISAPIADGLVARIKNAGELNNVKISAGHRGVLLESADLTVKNSNIS